MTKPIVVGKPYPKKSQMLVILRIQHSQRVYLLNVGAIVCGKITIGSQAATAY
jgi:hypothetical protein